MRIRSRAVRLVVAALLVAGGSLVATAAPASATFSPGDMCKGAGFGGERVNVPFSADGGNLKMGALPEGFDFAGMGVAKGSKFEALSLPQGIMGQGGGSISLEALGGLMGQGKGGGFGAILGKFGGGHGFDKGDLFVCGKKRNFPDCHDNGRGNDGKFNCDDRQRCDDYRGKNRPVSCDDRDRDRCDNHKGKNRPAGCDYDRDRDRERCDVKGDRPSWCDKDRDRDRDRCESGQYRDNGECVARPVNQPGPPQAQPDRLPNTGFDNTWLLLVAGGLLAGGAGIVMTPRLRTLVTRRLRRTEETTA